MAAPDTPTKADALPTATTTAPSQYSQPDDDPSLPSPPFHDLVILLEEISRKPREKTKLLTAYLKNWRTNGYGPMFAVIRLLLPQLDRERSRYGLKEQKMADLYIHSLNVGAGSDAANKLKNWKEGMRSSAGDFSLVAFEVIGSRSLVTHSQGQTVRDMNQLLTKLSKRDSNNAEIFKTFVQTFTALENKWIVRIINRDLKIGMSENSVLPCYHPDAAELFNVCSDLRKTVLDCADPSVRISTSSVTLSNPFKPMLSKKLHSAKEVVESMNHQPFWIENKLDGERVQIHKDGDNYRYWSRNSTEFTHLYGATPNEGSLTPFLHPLITSKANSLILDGEMVEYDPATKEILKFGTVKTAGGDHSSDDHKRRPLLFVFDVLFMNGASLIEHPLESRQEMLPALIPKEEEGRVRILQHEVGTTEAHIIDAIDAAVLDRQEGVIIKDPKSKYIPNGRGPEWIKLKPEYVDGVFDSLDVLIVGGYYGSGSRGGHNMISSYLCAVRDDTGRALDGKKWVTFCKFGTGFTFEQMGSFSRRLSPHWKEFKHVRHNPWVDLVDNAKMRPDVIIDPEKSIVVEIKAAEIIANSTSYAAQYTLRFPRFLHIREDKDAYSCMTLSEVYRMYKDFSGKLSTKSVDSSRSIAPSKKKLGGGRKTVQAQLLPSAVGDMTKYKVEEDIFKGQVFWVVRGDRTQTKQSLEILIKKHGGIQSQSQKKENTILVAVSDGPDLKGYKDIGDRNIVLPTWIHDCIAEHRVIPFTPKYMVFATPETEKQFRLVMDEYQDSFFEPLSLDAFQEILDNMPNRSQVIEKRRMKMAQARAAKIKVKRLNNLADQIEHTPTSQSLIYTPTDQDDNEDQSEGDQTKPGTNGRRVGLKGGFKRAMVEDGALDYDTKQAILKIELDHPSEILIRKENARARRIAASLTSKYYGMDGELQGPLGMFQGVKVFIVYPPKPEDYLESLSGIQRLEIKEEERESGKDLFGQPPRKVPRLEDDHSDHDLDSNILAPMPAMFDILSKALRDHPLQSEKSMQRKAKSTESTDDPIVKWILDRRDELDQTLQILNNYAVCRNNLDLVSLLLQHHGGQVVPEAECSIEHCQKLLRRYRLDSHKVNEGEENDDDDNEDDEDNFGLPTRICILFDPIYLDPVNEWSKAMQFKTLYGYSEIQAVDEAASRRKKLERARAGSLALPRPRLVTSTWVTQSHEKEFALPEEGFYPVVDKAME